MREDYQERKAQLERLPECIATEKERLTAIKSSLSERTRNSAADRQERDAAILVTIDRLKAEYNLARREVALIDKILATLNETERRCVELMDLNRQQGAIDRLCYELNYDKSMVYDVYNTALDKISRLYWGRL